MQDIVRKRVFGLWLSGPKPDALPDCATLRTPDITAKSPNTSAFSGGVNVTEHSQNESQLRGLSPAQSPEVVHGGFFCARKGNIPKDIGTAKETVK